MLNQNSNKTIKALDENMNLVSVPMKDTRQISGKRYIKDRSCIKMSDGQWHRINNGKIFYNASAKKWTFDRKPLLLGVTGIKEDGTLLIQYIDKNSPAKIPIHFSEKFFKENNTLFENGVPSFAMNIRIVREGGFIENMNNGVFNKIVPSEVGPKTTHLFSKQGIAPGYGPLNYNYSDGGKYVRIAEKISEKNLKLMTLSKEFKSVNDFLKGVTFGAEFETNSGYIPNRILSPLGAVPLRDGSIGGAEFTTIPLSGAKGLLFYCKLLKEAENRCFVDRFCSLHYHIGGLKRTRKAVLSLYMLAFRIQNDIYDMMPPYKRDLQYFNSKREAKDHCAPLRRLGINTAQHYTKSKITDAQVKQEFDRIFSLLTEGHKESTKYSFDTGNHPKVGQSKWNWNSRYYWINFLPIIFQNKKTVEFRVHHSTFSIQENILWLLICVSLVKYANKNEDKILKMKEKITLDDVLMEEVGEFDKNLYEKMTTLIMFKVNLFYKDQIKNNIYGEIDRIKSGKFRTYPTILDFDINSIKLPIESYDSFSELDELDLENIVIHNVNRNVPIPDDAGYEELTQNFSSYSADEFIAGSTADIETRIRRTISERTEANRQEMRAEILQNLPSDFHIEDIDHESEDIS